MSRKNANSEVIKSLRKTINRNKNIPKVYDFIEETNITFTTINIQFGSWIKLIEECGFKPVGIQRQQQNCWLKTEIRILAKQSVSIIGRYPTTDEFDSFTETPSISTVNNKFGTWENFVSVVEFNQSQYKLDKEVILSNVDWYCENFNNYSLSCYLCNLNTPRLDNIIETFGSLNEFISSTNNRIFIQTKTD